MGGCGPHVHTPSGSAHEGSCYEWNGRATYIDWKCVKPYPAATSVLKCCLLFTSAAFIQDYFMEANNMIPDQIASKDLGPYCWQYWLPNNISRRVEQTTKVVTGGKKLNYKLLKFFSTVNLSIKRALKNRQNKDLNNN